MPEPCFICAGKLVVPNRDNHYERCPRCSMFLEALVGLERGNAMDAVRAWTITERWSRGELPARPRPEEVVTLGAGNAVGTGGGHVVGYAASPEEAGGAPGGGPGVRTRMAVCSACGGFFAVINEPAVSRLCSACRADPVLRSHHEAEGP